MEIALVVVVVVALIAAFFLFKKKPAPPTTETASKPLTAQRVAGQQKAKEPKEPSPKAASPKTEASAAVGSRAGQTDPLTLDSDEGSSSLETVEEELRSAPDFEAPDDASPPPPPHRSPAPPDAARRATISSLRTGLARSRASEGFFGKLKNLLSSKKELSADLHEHIEELLLVSDVGVSTTTRILDRVKESLSKSELAVEETVMRAVRDEARRTIAVEGTAGAIVVRQQPTVVLFVGVNGAGKTTTIGKLAQKLTGEGKRVMLAAGDTFRAAAVEQLKAWGERTSCQVIAGKPEADPSSVLFDAIAAAKEAGVDVLLADTAGRLHTKTNLMQEMTKIAKTANKALPGAPHEVFLVIDATNGQNAMAQAKEFKEALPLTGLVLTKLDGTAKGGVVLGICDTLQVPVRYVGMGEKAADLHEFDPSSFIEALLGTEDDEIAA